MVHEPKQIGKVAQFYLGLKFYNSILQKFELKWVDPSDSAHIASFNSVLPLVIYLSLFTIIILLRLNHFIY